MSSLERYRMRQTYFGSVQSEFVRTGWTLFKRGWWICALCFVLLASTFFIFVASTRTATESGISALQVIIFLMIPLVLALLPLAMAIFTRWHIDGLRFGDVTATSNFRAGAYYKLIFKLIFSSLGFLIALGLVAGLVTFLLESFFTDAMAEMEEFSRTWLSVGLLAVMGYLIAMLGLGVLQRYFLGRGLWAATVTSTTISNLQAVDAVVAAGQPSGVLGEGLADALDFNVGI